MSQDKLMNAGVFSTEWIGKGEERIFDMGFCGTGRCGTKWVSEIMQSAGYDIPHESLGKDGSCGWNTVFRPAEAQPIFFKWMIHLIREPLACIGSLTTFDAPTWNHITTHFSRHITMIQPILYRCMMHYLYWNGICGAIANTTIQIEEFNPDMMCSAAFQYATGIDFDIWDARHAGWKTKNFNQNKREHTQLTWEDLNEACPKLAMMVQRYAKQNGYKC